MPHLVAGMARAKLAGPDRPLLAYLRRAHGAYVKTWNSVPLAPPPVPTEDASPPLAEQAESP